MEEIARSFSDIGLPDGFALAAAQVYERLTSFKDASSSDVSLDDVIDRLVAGDQA
jgi:hypothetical protein